MHVELLRHGRQPVDAIGAGSVDVDFDNDDMVLARDCNPRPEGARGWISLARLA